MKLIGTVRTHVEVYNVYDTGYSVFLETRTVHDNGFQEHQSGVDIDYDKVGEVIDLLSKVKSMTGK